MRILTKQIMLAAIFAAGISLNAHALLLTPSSPGWQGSAPKNPDADAVEAITGTSAQLSVAYKDNFGGNEAGTLAGSYNTEYLNSASDPSDAKITYTGGTVLSGSPIFLLVKDGSTAPSWYVFDISGWNGTDNLRLSGFWPEQGAISHVSIFVGVPNGGNGEQVPDPGSTMVLLGIALTSIGLIRRKVTVA
jgi:hypothetical protein